MNSNFREPDSRRRAAPRQGQRPIIIQSSEIIAGNLWITMSDGLTYNVGPVTGQAGPAGPQGNPGPAGSGWSEGAGAPVSPGNLNDMYLDTQTSNVYRWDNGWGQVGNIKGQQGETGETGAQGPPGIVGVQQTRITTSISGEAVWTFDPPFADAPFIAYAVQNTDPLPYMMMLSDCTSTSVSIQLRHAQTLPALILNLTALFGFNTFAGVSLGGVSVHLIALPPHT